MGGCAEVLGMVVNPQQPCTEEGVRGDPREITSCASFGEVGCEGGGTRSGARLIPVGFAPVGVEAVGLDSGGMHR